MTRSFATVAATGPNVRTGCVTVFGCAGVTAGVAAGFGVELSLLRTTSQTTKASASATATTAPMRIGPSRARARQADVVPWVTGSAYESRRTENPFFCHGSATSSCRHRQPPADALVVCDFDLESPKVLDAAVGHVDDVFDARPAQERGGERAAVAGRACDGERLVAREAGRRPVAELVVGDVERRPLLEELVCARRRERLERGGLGDERPAVQLDDALEVRRLRREVAGQLADELVLALDPEQRVEAALEAERRPGLLAHPRAAAERAADVRRPDLEEVLLLEQLAEGAVQVSRALLGLDGQVRPCHVADEQRVAGQDEPGALVAASVLDEEREVLGPVAGRADGGDPRLANLDRRSLLEWLVVVLGFRLARDVECRPGRRREPPVAGEVVGVVVRLEHVPDLEVVLAREVEVLLDLPLRVDDRRLAAVGDHVRGTAEILVQHLPEEHLGAWAACLEPARPLPCPLGEVVGLPRARLVPELALVRGVLFLQLHCLLVDLARAQRQSPDSHSQSGHARSRSAEPSSSRRRHASPAARPSGVWRKCSSGTWTKPARASASGSSPSRSSPRMRIRRPRLDSTVARTRSSVSIGTGWRERTKI